MTKTKLYVGVRGRFGAKVAVHYEGTIKALRKRLDLFNHSPTGFEWGYAGSGPAQLSLALLADALGDDKEALRLHQDFKFAVITGLPRNSWKLTREEVLGLVVELQARRQARGVPKGCNDPIKGEIDAPDE